MPKIIMSNLRRSTGMFPSVCVTVCVPGDKYMPLGREGVGVEKKKEGGWEKE